MAPGILAGERLKARGSTGVSLVGQRLRVAGVRGVSPSAGLEEWGDWFRWAVTGPGTGVTRHTLTDCWGRLNEAPGMKM